MTAAKWVLALALVGLAMGPRPSAAQQDRLFFTSMSPADSSNSVFFNEWASRVNAAAKGALDLEVKDSVTLANFANVYDRVLDDVVQIGWGQQAFIPGKFPLSEVVSLPFLVDDDVVGSVAFWRLYKSGMLDSEYQQVVPLWLGLLGASDLHFSKPIPTLANLQGLKIRVSGKVQSEVVTALGGSPISLAADDMYEGLQRGTIDGVVTSWSAFAPYRLYEVSFYHVEAPLGNSASMFFMSRAKFDSLPKAVQKVLTDNSGEAESRAFGQHDIDQAKIMRDKTTSGAHQQIVQLSPEVLASWRKRAQPVIEDWENGHPGGDKIVAAFRKIYQEVKEGR